MAQQVTVTLNYGTLNTTAATKIYKWSEANKDDANFQRTYHLEHSKGNRVDTLLLNEYIDNRVRQIADMTSEYLSSFATDETMASYTFMLPSGWNVNTYEDLVKLFENYVTDGSVADWFSNAGVEQGKVFNAKALEHAVGIQRNIYHKNTSIS